MYPDTVAGMDSLELEANFQHVVVDIRLDILVGILGLVDILLEQVVVDTLAWMDMETVQAQDLEDELEMEKQVFQVLLLPLIALLDFLLPVAHVHVGT